MDKNQVRLDALNYIGAFDHKIETKFSNICAKTGQYDVPSELFQKRTPRKNRVLLPWKAVKANRLTLDQLETFYGGVAVELVNDDYFAPENQGDPVFRELIHRIGSNQKVSAVISIRSESGSSSSAVQREFFSRLINNTCIEYNGNTVTLNSENYMDFALSRISKGGVGNEKWAGFLFVSIRGGQQDTIETHRGKELLIFNPACEYASPQVCVDLDLIMSYYALLSIDPDMLTDRQRHDYDLHFSTILRNVEQALAESYYSNDTYVGNLLDYAQGHPSVKMIRGQLTDPIQIERIRIMDFAVDNKDDPRNLDFTHDEAVNIGRYYWDSEKKTILSPARPTNVFWSKHLSNMMQQNFSLSGYFAHEKAISQRRAELLGDN